MQTISLSYDPRTRALTADSDGAGTTIDDCAVSFHIDPIEGCTMDLMYGVIIYDGGRRYHPFGRFDQNGDLTLKHQVLAACTGGQLPIRLRLTYDDRRVIGSRQLFLDVDVAPDSFADLAGAYGDIVMQRTDGWVWIDEWTYDQYSMVWWGGKLWLSLKDDNVGHVPGAEGSEEWWDQQGVDGVSPTVEFEDDVLIVVDVNGEHRSPKLGITVRWDGTVLTVIDRNGEHSMDLIGPRGPQGLPAESTVPGEFVRRYIGDGRSLEYDVLHNLHTDSPFWQALDLSRQPPEYVQVAASVVDDCHIRLHFSRAPVDSSILVIVSSGIGTMAPPETSVPGALLAQYIGDRIHTVFDVEHNMHSELIIVQFQDLSGERVCGANAAYECIDEDHIRVTLGAPVDYNSVRVLMSSGLGVEPVNEAPYVWEPGQAMQEWRIEHNRGRPTPFAVYDTAKRRLMCAEIIESDDVTIETFGAPVNGRAVALRS